MVWSKLETNTLSSASLDIDLGASTAMSKNTFSYTLHSLIDDGTGSNGDGVHAFTLNNDSASNYAHRVSQDYGSDNTFTGQAFMATQYNVSPNDSFVFQYIAAIDGEEILQQSIQVDIVSTGAGTAPRVIQTVNKYTGTSQFTRLDCRNNRGTSIGYEYDDDSNATIFGSDVAEILNVQDGAVYYDKTLNKEYILSNETWTEL